MGGTKPKLSIGETVTLIPIVLTAVTSLFVALLSYPFTVQRPQGLIRATAFAVVRQLFGQATPRQLQAIAPDSEEAYNSAAKSKGFSRETVTLDDGTKAHWIGSPRAKNVLLYLHGGGYVMFANVAHYTALYTNVAARQGSETSVLLLSYDLAPEAPYPRQLQQAALALQHLLTTRSPSTILIGGDSAGGNLTAALLSHLAHPHPTPSIPRITLPEPLLGVIFISPWVGFNIGKPSYQKNEFLDLIPPVATRRWSAAYMGPAKPDYYNEPIRAPSSWWNDVPVKDVLITGGDEEILVDDIREFATKFEEAHPATQVLIAKGESHDQLVGNEIRGSPPAESDGAVYDWIAAR